MRAAPLTLFASLILLPNLIVCAQDKAGKELAAESAQFRALMRNSPVLQLKLTELPISPPRPGWKTSKSRDVIIGTRIN